MSLSPPPPGSLSLPSTSSSSNPKKRPSINSLASTTSQQQQQQPAKKQRLHPLRQTSFPATADLDPRVFSATTIKSEANDAVSVTGSFTGSLGAGSFDGGAGAGRGRKKKDRREREGTGSMRGSVSVRDQGIGGGRGGSVVEGQEDGEGDEDDEAADPELMGVSEEAGQNDAEAERKNLAILVDSFTPDQSDRYDSFKRARLNKATMRKIVNQTLSQSVPPSVITTICGYSKVFVGELIERARDVQEEWARIVDDAAIAEIEARETERRVKLAEEEEEKNKKKQGTIENGTTQASASNAKMNGTTSSTSTTQEESKDPAIKTEEAHSSTTNLSQSIPSIPPVPVPTQTTPSASLPTNKIPLHKLPPNPHRGQLLPQHIREALRRYKRDCEGANVGFSGMSTGGLGVKGSFTWGVRGGGGRRIFR